MKLTELCKIAYKYGTDKCPQIEHSYTPFYFDFFKDKRNKIKKVMEVGIAKGASLRMWRDFFPKAQIYGVDINPKFLFTEERITTIKVNQMHGGEWDSALKQTGTDIDVFIDDGLHATIAQINTCKYLMSKLDKGVIYIIEDVRAYEKVFKGLGADFDYFIPGLMDFGNKKDKSSIMIVKPKNG